MQQVINQLKIDLEGQYPNAREYWMNNDTIQDRNEQIVTDLCQLIVRLKDTFPSMNILFQIWDIDRSVDGRAVFNVKMLTRNFLDKYAYCQQGHIAHQSYTHNIDAVEEAIENETPTALKHFYQKNNEQLDEFDDNQFLPSQINDFLESSDDLISFYNLLKYQQSKVETLMALKRTPKRRRFLRFLNKMMFSEIVVDDVENIAKVYKYVVTTQSLIQLHGLSDSDYIKAVMMFDIFDKVVYKWVEIKLSDCDFIPFLCIKIANLLNKMIKMGEVNYYYLIGIQAPDVAGDNFKMLDQLKYRFRPEVGRLFNLKERKNVILKAINFDNNVITNLVQDAADFVIKTQRDGRLTASQREEQIKRKSRDCMRQIQNMQAATLSKTSDIFNITYNLIRMQYINYYSLRNLIQEKLYFFITYVVRTPNLSEEDQPIYRNMVTYYRLKFAKETDDIVLGFDGQCVQYYTVDLRLPIDLTLSQGDVVNELKRAFMKQIINIICNYEDKDSFRISSLGFNMDNLIIENIQIRPFIFRDAYEAIKKRVENKKSITEQLQSAHTKILKKNREQLEQMNETPDMLLQRAIKALSDSYLLNQIEQDIFTNEVVNQEEQEIQEQAQELDREIEQYEEQQQVVEEVAEELAPPPKQPRKNRKRKPKVVLEDEQDDDQFEDELKIFKKEPEKKIKRNAIITPADLLMETIFKPASKDYQHKNCQKVTKKYLMARCSASKRDYKGLDDDVVIKILVQQLGTECFVIDYANPRLNQQFENLKEQLEKVKLLIFTSASHIFISEVSENLSEIDFYTLENILNQHNLHEKYIKKSMFMAQGDINKHLRILKDLMLKGCSKSKTIYAHSKYINTLLKPVKFHSNCQYLSKSKELLSSIRFDCYYDFETTFNDMNVPYQNSLKKINLSAKVTEVREQVDFMCGALYKVYLPFNSIFNALLADIECRKKIISQHDFQKIKCIHSSLAADLANNQEIDAREMIFEGIPSTDSFMTFNYNLMSKIEGLTNDFNRRIKLFRKCLASPSIIQNAQARQSVENMIKKINWVPKMNLYAYNAARFDNHFILQYVKSQYRDNWMTKVKYIGDLNNSKVLVFDSRFIFKDMCLMLAGKSLKEMCVDFKLSSEFAKKDIDMAKMKTLSEVMKPENYAEIKDYVLHDVRAIYQLHAVFKDCIAQSILDIMNQSQEFKDAVSECKYLPDKSNEKLKKYAELCISDWTTMSSLAVQFFSVFYNSFPLKGPSDFKVYEFMKASYQGGFTQNFCIGQSKQKTFYFDFNSMYPAAMSKILFPTDLSEFKFTELLDQHQKITRSQWMIKYQCGQMNRQHLFDQSAEFFQLNRQTSDYDLFHITQFKFSEKCKAPFFGLRTKHGTIYPLQFDSESEGEKLTDKLVIYGFQLNQAFIFGHLEEISYDKILKYSFNESANICVEKPVFQKYVQTEYKKRQAYKNQKNDAMAQSIKIFLNSLYGKFGESQHPQRVVISEAEFQSEEILNELISQKILQAKELDIEEFKQKSAEEAYSLKFQKLNDVKNNFYEMIISDYPTHPNHLGSFVYYASLITAICRTHMLSVINKVFDLGGQVFYADTDSIVLNEKGYNIMKKDLKTILTLDKDILGAMKNEYPLQQDHNSTSIVEFNLINKKIYQLKMANGLFKNKFKGCRNPEDTFYTDFVKNSQYQQQQTRFFKQKGGITIGSMNMDYNIRLSRHIQQNQSQNDDQLMQYLPPFQNLNQFFFYYNDPDQRVYYNQSDNTWQYFKK